jgi:hypothetical protein
VFRTAIEVSAGAVLVVILVETLRVARHRAAAPPDDPRAAYSNGFRDGMIAQLDGTLHAAER